MWVGIIVLIILLFVGVTYLKTSNNNEKWPWPEYPENFANVDCTTVPLERVTGPNSDVPYPLRFICWQERASHENRAEFCANIDLSENCYIGLARKLMDESICNNPGVNVDKCTEIVRSDKKSVAP